MNIVASYRVKYNEISNNNFIVIIRYYKNKNNGSIYFVYVFLQPLLSERV